MNRPFNRKDKGKLFICTAINSSDKHMFAHEQRKVGGQYKLIGLNKGQGIFESMTCWGSTCSYASDQFEPA